LCVQDTGAGLDDGAAAPLVQMINDVTKEAHAIARETAERESGTPALSTAPTLPSNSADRAEPEQPSEGIGLSIVKRLCELLDASMELETQRGRGTTFRIIFPSRYPD
jgi:sensor histidine kinase regulating citrate/malate metabolism